MRLDDPELVRREYASETVFAERRKVFTELVEGPNADDIALAAVAEVEPECVVDVGCGDGRFAARLARELGVDVVAFDLSARMVQLARERGVNASLGDVERLPAPDGAYDCAVANWMLYHVPHLERGLAELARVLRPGGRLVAATFGELNLVELWRALGEETPPPQPFSRENGYAPLTRHFARVERRAADAIVVFPDDEAVRRYVGATIRRRHLAGRVPRFRGPFRARSSQAVFVADKAA